MTLHRHESIVFQFLIWPMIAAGISPSARADWPQFGGPQRNFVVADKVDLATIWTEKGPRERWKRPLGDGYGAISAVDGRLFVMYRQDEQEHIAALSAATGDTLWDYSYPAPLLPNTDLDPGSGPHATPLVANGRVYAVGVTGIFHCLGAVDGEFIWSHDLVHDQKGTVLFRGYSSSPVAYDGSVILPVGGPGRAVMAFDADNGQVQWKCEDFATSHASPVLVTHQGRDHLVVFADRTFAGLDPANGELLWMKDHPVIGGHICSMPVADEDGHVVFSCAYGGGMWCLELPKSAEEPTITESWHNNKMRVHHSNILVHDGHVYASSGDFGPKIFTSVSCDTGEMNWQDRRLGRASVLLVGNTFLALEENGKLLIIVPSPNGLKILAEKQLFDARAWSPPTLVGKTLFVRNREAIMAFDLP